MVDRRRHRPDRGGGQTRKKAKRDGGHEVSSKGYNGVHEASALRLWLIVLDWHTPRKKVTDKKVADR